MGSEPPSAPPSAPPLSSRAFDALLLALGLSILVGLGAKLLYDGEALHWSHLVAIPLIVLIARFPLLLDRGDGGIEVGFDSCVLMFLISTLPPDEALFLWSVGVLASQLTKQKRAASKRFNIGLGIVGGAVATLVITELRGDVLGTPRELLAVAVGASCYFASDLLLTAVSIGLEESSPIRRQLIQPGMLVAVACFVPFDSLGYLGAVVYRSAPPWTVSLLAVPLVTLLVATRAVTRGRENARRLGVLFGAAERTQSLTETRQVIDALIDDARSLLQLPQVEVRPSPPGENEIGAKLYDGQRDLWIAAPKRHRARSTSAADQQGLEAMCAVASDTFARLHMTDEMTHLARHDVLTNLPNRALLTDRLEHALRLSRRDQRQVALLFCDLDGFKQVNDRFGHAAGDEVLVDVAQRLSECVREIDTVARLGGDEFAILLEDVRPGLVDAVCHRILAAVRSSARVREQKFQLSTSIGVALSDDSPSAEHLLRNADLSMYEAKGLGKDRHVLYQPSFGQSRVRRLEMVESLRSAVAARQLGLVYQPIVELATQKIVGLEALARWTMNGVPVPPEVFISAAEESGLVGELGDLIMDLVAEDAASLLAAADNDLNIAINVSAQQLRAPRFVSTVEAVMGRIGGTGLVLEITERDFVDDDPTALDAMVGLCAQGVQFAIDDFGVGFSSIGYLQNMPVKILKVDRSFSSNVDRDERSCGLLRSIVLMGQALGLDVVVEGLERESQVGHLLEHVGAAYAQGFLMHRPMAVGDAVEALRANRALVRTAPQTGVTVGSAPAAS